MHCITINPQIEASGFYEYNSVTPPGLYLRPSFYEAWLVLVHPHYSDGWFNWGLMALSDHIAPLR